MFELLRKSLKDLKKVHKEVITFQFIYFFLTGLVFVPIITAIFNRTLKSLGISFLLNQDIFTLGINYQGILGIAVIAIISVIIVFIEISVLVIIAQKQYFDQAVTISDALGITVRRIPKIFGLGVIQIMLLLLFLILVVDSPLTSKLLKNTNIPIWIRMRFIEPNWFTLLYAMGFLAAIYLVLRWIFTIHYIVIEKQPSRRAIKNSQRLTRRNELKIILYLFIFNVVVFGLGVWLISTINHIPSFLTKPMQSDLVKKYLMTLTGYLTFGFTIFILPVNILWITRLFYRIRRQKGEEIEDSLILGHNKFLGKIESGINRFLKSRRYLILAVITVYLTITFLMNYTATEDILRWNVEIAAHRGGGIVGPENSLSSIQNSLDKNVTVLEIDVQMTKDGIIVLNHDSNLQRVAGVNAKVSDLTYEELKQIIIGYPYAEEHLGEHIPSLDAVLGLVKDKARLIIEIKTYSYNQEMIGNLVSLIEEHDMVEQCMIQSFSYRALSEVRELNSGILVGQILYAVAGNSNILDVDFYTIKQSMLSEAFIKNAHKQGRSMWVWTVNDEVNIKEVLKYDVDGIITDYPKRVQDIMGR
ncbi:MAG: glycerophosphoryl diester phosphodiesterase membrane domain-containing protein [Vallitaleaceae bacterium]|jgi:glycerophosphoryl diester phosphodiesterase|nr:glycerophosphoryl diester phosphodiesterase membrane domain-containing protein [Vallitaleaceae bacterium]